MTSPDQQLYTILNLFNHLSFDDRIWVIQQLIAALQPHKTSKNPKKSLLKIAGTGQGMYGDIDAFLKNERDWDR